MSKFRFNRKAQRFRSRKSAILEKMANNAVNHFKVTVFDRQSFDGKAWAPLKNPDATRQPLVKTGRLRESITILSRTKDSRRVGSNVPYAKHHNEGGKHLPKRQIIGKSRELEAENRRYLNTQIKGIL